MVCELTRNSILFCLVTMRKSPTLKHVHMNVRNATFEPDDMSPYIYVYIYSPHSVLTDGVLAVFLKDQ
jgi:hypothetical protein